MRIDAEIAEHIINHFTDQGISVLAIHDSFLINRAHEGDLRPIMQTACNKVAINLLLIPMELTIEQALQQGIAAHKEGKLPNVKKLYRAML